MPIDRYGSAWGSNGSPILPATLRELWATENLPNWIQRDLGLSSDATFAALTSDPWLRAAVIPERVFNAMTTLVSQRADQIASIRCIATAWPIGLSPDAVPWSNRTRNSLKRTGLYSSTPPEITFGRFMSIQGAGARSALDYAATLESAMQEFNRAGSVVISELTTAADAANRKDSSLLDAAAEPWANQVSGEDPRFADLLPTVQSMSFRDYVLDVLTSSDATGRATEVAELIRNLDEVKARARAIETLTLEAALAEILKIVVPKVEQQEPLRDRLGWAGSAPITLEQAGQQLGVTRERIRQIESRALGRLPKSHTTYLPALDALLERVAKAAPISAPDALKLTMGTPYSIRGFHPAALMSVATAFKHETTFDLSIIKGATFVTTTDDHAQLRILSMTARKLAGASGAFNVNLARTESEKLGARLNDDQIRNIFHSFAELVPLDEQKDWWRFISLPQGRDRLENLAKKMLSVAAPLHVRTIRDGAFRVFRWRAATSERFRDRLVVPPASILRAFFDSHEAFQVQGEFVSCLTPLDSSALLGDGEKVLVDIIRSSATGVVDRATLAREAFAKGLGDAWFTILTSFSPVLERVGLGIWKIRGAVVDPAAVESLRQQIRDTPRERRIINYGWTTDGAIWLAARTPHSPSSMVVGVPAPLQSFFTSVKFEAFLEDGTSCGAISQNDGTLYNFYGFARAAALEEGDVVKMTFELSQSTVRLEIVDQAALEE
jgi:hypothetical protein